VVEFSLTDSSPKSALPEKTRKNVSVRKQNDEAARAILAGMGYTGPFTKNIRDAALAMLEMEKNACGQ